MQLVNKLSLFTLCLQIITLLPTETLANSPPEFVLDDNVRLGLCVLNFLSILSEFLWREKLTQKWLETKAEQFSKLQFWNDKIDHNTNFVLLVLPSVKRLFFYNSTSYLQLLSFWRYFLCQFLRERKSERIERKFKTQNPNLRGGDIVVRLREGPNTPIGSTIYRAKAFDADGDPLTFGVIYPGQNRQG